MSLKHSERNVFALTVPRQHGAWSALISCFILGTAVGGSFGMEAILLLVSVFTGFLARHSAALYLRLSRTDDNRKKVLTLAIGYFSVFLSVGALLVIWYELRVFLLLGFFALVFLSIMLILEQQRREFTIMGELIGMVGLSLVAPAAEYSTTGVFSTQTVGLWIICSLFFGGSVFHVRYLVRKRIESTGPSLVRIRAGLPSVAYHLAALAVAVSLGTFIGILPSFSPMALLPVTLKALWAVGRRYKAPLPVHRIGYVELIHTLIFVFLAVSVFHMPA